MKKNNNYLKFDFLGIRKARGLTQQRFADITGIARNGVSEIENGKRVPTFDTMSSIVLKLNLSKKELNDIVSIDMTKFY